MEFRPQKVPIDSWKIWLREGVSLSTRRYWLFIGVTFSFGLLSYLPMIGNSLLFFIPLLLAVACIAAYCSDESKPFINTIKEKPIIVWLRILIVGITPWMIIYLFGLLLSIFIEPSDQFVPDKPDMTSIIYEPGIAIFAPMFLWFVLMSFIGWFIIPLISLQELPILKSIELSMDALDMNKFVIGLIIIISFSAFFSMITPILVFPWLAIVSCTIYVSYRHIWFDKGLNEPIVKISLQQIVNR